MNGAAQSYAWLRLMRGLAPARSASARKVAATCSMAGREPKPRGPDLPNQLQFLVRPYAELDVSLDPATQALWCHMRPVGPPSFTPGMVRELNVLHSAIEGLFEGQSGEGEPPIRYYVQGSRIPGIYNLGGDLAFLDKAIRAGDREALKRYAFGCVKAVHAIATGFDCGVVSVGLVQGDALGGGLEGALCCNFIIAERSAQLGFPEILFHAFPGMGGYSLIARRVGGAVAERMMFNGKVHTAQEMFDMGLVDMVVDDGRGEDAVRDYIGSGARDHAVRQAIFRVRQRVSPLHLDELRDVTELWVDTVLRLEESDLRRMRLLHTAQQRRLSRIGKAAPTSTYHAETRGGHR